MTLGHRIFLTGVSGYLGSVLAEKLAKLPEVDKITGLDVSPPSVASPKLSFVSMDIRSPDLVRAMAGHDVVVNTAFIVQWLASMPASVRDDINLNGMRNVARAAAANKVRRFIHTSSVAAYDPRKVDGKINVTEDFSLGTGKSSLYYWNAKATAERIIVGEFKSSETVTTFFRPFYVMGPKNRITIPEMNKSAVNFFGRDPQMQFIHEEDIGDAFVRAVRTNLPGAYNVVPDDSVHISQVWKILGHKWVPTVPVWLARGITAAKWKYFGSRTHPSWVEASLVSFNCSNTKLKAAGWRPRYGSVEALRTALSGAI